jgi:protein SCO1/2
MKKFALIAVALVLAALLGCQQARDPKLPPGGDFVLQSADGPVDSRSFRGKVMLVYFGYTNCPDVCPASLAAGGQALNALTPDERKRVKLIMVSVDPERDSLKHLKEYTAFFHGEMIGVTGTTAEIASLAKSFGAGYIKQPAKADGSYAVDHTVSTYVVDSEGKLAAVLDLGVTTDKLVATVRKLL